MWATACNNVSFPHKYELAFLRHGVAHSIPDCRGHIVVAVNHFGSKRNHFHPVWSIVFDFPEFARSLGVNLIALHIFVAEMHRYHMSTREENIHERDDLMVLVLGSGSAMFGASSSYRGWDLHDLVTRSFEYQADPVAPSHKRLLYWSCVLLTYYDLRISPLVPPQRPWSQRPTAKAPGCPKRRQPVRFKPLPLTDWARWQALCLSTCLLRDFSSERATGPRF
ncbi:hypothetical protein BD779DRAFT_339805 [Infundibulicybe gibba]|nr:hypothetical protein BD779DRAFT_339805 [Infundibulicybe gibba]